MALLNLNLCFPPDAQGNHGPLPKQARFLKAALDPKGPKYISFTGGIGGGKTLIGCITVLAWAIMYPSDYVIGRLYAPELKVTTLKTFLEICPPELIHEHRVADGIVRIKAAGGKISNIIFRGLDEPDKLRSLNLGGAYIDEATQVSEAAFMLLQGRLRGNGLRKIILTSNPNGHDWVYNWFVKKDNFTDESTKKLYELILAPSTENRHLPEGYLSSLMGSWSKDRIEREIMGSFDSFSGQIYDDFRRDVHVIKPFRIPDDWTRVVGADHGYRNPACFLWGAVDFDGNVYVYREFYEREMLIEEICRGHKKDGRKGIVQLTGKEKLDGIWIDPSTRATRGQTGESDWDEYLRHLPRDWALLMAKNDVMLGVDRVKSYLKVDTKTGRPKLFIFDTCSNLIEELTQYRWKPLQSGQEGKSQEKEEPVKVDDHSADALRYLLMSRPEGPKPDLQHKKQMEARTSEYYLRQELEGIRNPKPKDPFGD